MEDWTVLPSSKRHVAIFGQQALRIGLSILSLALLVVAVGFGINGSTSGVTAAGTIALFCLFFVFLPYFSEVSLFGFKAKTLDRKILEVEVLLGTH